MCNSRVPNDPSSTQLIIVDWRGESFVIVGTIRYRRRRSHSIEHRQLSGDCRCDVPGIFYVVHKVAVVYGSDTFGWLQHIIATYSVKLWSNRHVCLCRNPWYLGGELPSWCFCAWHGDLRFFWLKLIVEFPSEVIGERAKKGKNQETSD